jgi:hypothetical protein
MGLIIKCCNNSIAGNNYDSRKKKGGKKIKISKLAKKEIKIGGHSFESGNSEEEC